MPAEKLIEAGTARLERQRQIILGSIPAPVGTRGGDEFGEGVGLVLVQVHRQVQRQPILTLVTE